MTNNTAHPSRMRTLKFIVIALTALCAAAPRLRAQTPADTITDPQVIYTAMPRTYTIAGIAVSGADNYNPEVVMNYAGLRVGERVQVPGSELTNAAKRLMAQGLFSQAQIVINKIAGNKVWIEYSLRQQPRIREVRYVGMKKSERDDIQEKLHLAQGNMITQNIVDLIVNKIKEYYDGKGYKNARVEVDLQDALDAPNEQIVTIKVDKRNKLKVHAIHFTGNEVFSDRQLRNAMKKTNIKTDLIKIFSQKKFVDTDYEADLERILEKYNEKGYRDAIIVADSVVP